MKSPASINALSIAQCISAIIACGHERTVLLQGHMGSGKSSILWELAERLPGHHACYFDCTTKDLGDIMIPNLKVGSKDHGDFVSFATNEELGVHHTDRPIILMLDEYGKANPAVKNALLRLMLERKIGNVTLHPKSIIFATTNLGVEGVGDLLAAHHRNRISVIEMRKPDKDEWVDWGIQSGKIDHVILAWARENPQLFADFRDVKNPADNPYIFNPRQPAQSFVTPRSLHAASDWIKRRAQFDNTTLQQALIGTIGPRAAADLNAFIVLADQLPSLDSIKRTPKTAKVPDNAAAVCMVVYRTLAALEADWADAWMTYMVRLDPEAQGLYVKNAVKTKSFDILKHNRKFGEWAVANNYMLSSADK